MKCRVRDIYTTQGVNKVKTSLASSGDIVTLQLQGNNIPGAYATLAATPSTEPLPVRRIDPPVVSVDVGPNTSPLQGQDGKYVRELIVDFLALLSASTCGI